MHRVAVAVVVLLSVATGGVSAIQPAPEGCGFPVTVTDATGAEVTVPEEPQRVVVLAPSAAQTMWEIDAADRVVGMPVNQYTSYLTGGDNRTNVVGADGQIVQPQVVDLEADLVLAPNVIRNDTVESLRRAGQTVYRFRIARSLDDVSDKTELTGRLVGELDAARLSAAQTRETIRTVEQAVEGRERPEVYYVLGDSYTAGSGTFINDVITAAGGQNIAASANVSGYAQLSYEVVAAEDPDWIVRQSGMALPRNDAVNGTTAVQEDQIVTVDANLINQPGPRVVDPLRNLATNFHQSVTLGAPPSVTVEPACPDTGSPTQSNDQATPESPAAENATATPSATETPGASGPGFTVGAVLLALLAVALVGNRSRE